MRKIVNFTKGIIDGTTSKRIIFSFGVLSFVLLIVLLLVMFFDSAAQNIENLLGTTNKAETIMFIGWAMSGAFVAIGLAVLSQRTEAQMRTAEAQVGNNKLVEKGHTQERFKTATEHLGNENASVRIAAFYEFLHLIKDNGEEYRKSILDILYAYMRTITDDFARREDVQEAERKNEPIKTTEEIQGLLDILFKSQDIDRSDIKPNLQRVCFSGADLTSGDLSGVDLSKADLSGAVLSKINLSGTNLSGVNWYRVNWPIVDLSGADLTNAYLSGAKLPDADLSEADLSGAKLFRANLSGANLSDAVLTEADLSGADLFGADLTGANLFRARLLGADLSDVNLTGANFTRANLLRAKFTGAKFTGVDFTRADLTGVDLSGVDLSGAKLSIAKLFATYLTGADLTGVDLTGTDLFGADLTGVNLLRAKLSGAKLSGADLSKAQLGEAFYTNETIFPKWLKPPIAPPDNGDKVQFPKGFIAPEKPEDDE